MTLVVSQDGVRAYVGQSEVASPVEIVLRAGPGRPECEVEVAGSDDLSEEDLRLIRALPWVRSVRKKDPGPSSA